MSFKAVSTEEASLQSATTEEASPQSATWSQWTPLPSGTAAGQKHMSNNVQSVIKSQAEGYSAGDQEEGQPSGIELDWVHPLWESVEAVPAWEQKPLQVSTYLQQ
jgi:hypothetical protein